MPITLRHYLFASKIMIESILQPLKLNYDNLAYNKIEYFLLFIPIYSKEMI